MARPDSASGPNHNCRCTQRASQQPGPELRAELHGFLHCLDHVGTHWAQRTKTAPVEYPRSVHRQHCACLSLRTLEISALCRFCRTTTGTSSTYQELHLWDLDGPCTKDCTKLSLNTTGTSNWSSLWSSSSSLSSSLSLLAAGCWLLAAGCWLLQT